MYLNDINTINPRRLAGQNYRRRQPRTLVDRAQAFLEAKLGTPESREIILGLLLANAQLQDVAKLAEEIIKADENETNTE